MLQIYFTLQFEFYIFSSISLNPFGTYLIYSQCSAATLLIQLAKLRKLSSVIDSSNGDGMDGGSGNDRVGDSTDSDDKAGDDKVGSDKVGSVELGAQTSTTTIHIQGVVTSPRRRSGRILRRYFGNYKSIKGIQVIIKRVEGIRVIMRSVEGSLVIMKNNKGI